VPEELGNRSDDVGIIIAALEGVEGLGAALRPRSHGDGLCIEAAAGWAVLQRLRHQCICRLRIACALLCPHRRQPKLLIVRVLQSRLALNPPHFGRTILELSEE
jgi:hypothetical protein